MKKIFYFTDLLPFLSKPDKAIDKLKRNLEIFKESSQDIQLIWHPYSRNEEFMKINRCTVINEYNKIIDEFKSAGWGQLDETSNIADAKEVLFECDAYYGDTCDLVYEAKNKGIPVMIQNVDIG
ncbi:MAG: hypothetical protein K6G43_12220 [Lachnospiraceae bacterium]|nr:hypothetical protein [Lachnospiraceae bacterium]